MKIQKWLSFSTFKSTNKWLLFFGSLISLNAFSAEHMVDLHVGYKIVNFSGEEIKAIAVNNQIPAPTLHFKEGDQVTINVYNHLDTGTTIHWHGILLPWQMDGVEGVTQYAIPPGGVYHYQFELKQSGTYWYHAHAGLQEQQGLYGAFLIDPLEPSTYEYTKDYVVVLSDWSNTLPNQIFANLKKEGDYYSPNFPLQPSLTRFIQDYRKASTSERQLIQEDYKMMQQMRMSIYDFNDVAYNTFLLNGRPPTDPWFAQVEIGDVVRLRFIGANAGVISRVKIPGTSMQMVNVQGHDVQPYTVNDFTIAPGETYDVLVTVENDLPYIIYAESTDTIGAAYGALITESEQIVNYLQVEPFPTPQPSTREMMFYMMGGHGMRSLNSEMDMSSMPGMNMDEEAMSMDHSMEMSGMQINRNIMSHPGTKYQNIVSPVPTNDPNKPVQIINMELYGYMGRFIWFINGVPEYKAPPIIIEPGKRYRIIFNNISMMHHPMHIHGHFFIFRNGHGAYDPLLHTIDVPPGATIVADFDANAGDGQWFFHCHFLYHMMSGMSRVFQYSNLWEKAEHNDIQQMHKSTHKHTDNDASQNLIELIRHPMAHPPGLYRATFLDIGADPFNNVQRVTFESLLGSDYNKLELYTEDAEVNHGIIEFADMDIFYWRLISEFWSIKGGANYYYRPSETPYWQPGMGIEGLMPYFIDTNIRSYFHEGSVKFDIQISRDTQITNNFFIRTGIRSILATKTVEDDGIGSGVNQMRYIIRPFYRLRPGLSAFFEYENETDYGAFADFQQDQDEATSQNTYTLGLAFLF